MSAPQIKSPQQAKKQQLNTVFIAVAGLLSLVMVGLYVTDKKSGQDKLKNRGPVEQELVKNYTLPSSQVRPEDKWQAEAGKQVSQTQAELDRLKAEQADLLARMEHLQNNPPAAAPAMPAGPLPGGAQATPAGGLSPERQALASNIVGATLPPPPPPPAGAAGSGSTPAFGGAQPFPQQPAAPVQRPEIMEIDLGKGEDKGPLSSNTAAPAGEGKDAKSTAKVKGAGGFVTAGSFAKVVLLSGIDAPTGGQAANMALPVVLRVKSFFNLPNFYRANLKECFLVGNAYGDISSERTMIRLSKLSCGLKNGQLLEVDVKGHVAGEDGSFGFRSRVVSKQGQLLAKTFFSGLFSGLGNSIAAQNTVVTTSPLGTTQTIDPNKTMQAGLGTGASTALNKLADFYMSQAQTIFPILETASGRVGEAYLLEGVDFGSARISNQTSDGAGA